MKKILLAVLQFFMFLLTFAAGSFLAPFRIKWFITHPGPLTTRFFIADGLLLMLALYGLVMLIEAMLKKVRTMGVWTTGALLLAAVLGLAMKLGFVTRGM